MTDPFQLIDESYFIIDAWKKINPNLIAGFTTKNGGFSAPPFTSNNQGLHVNDKRQHVVQNRRELSEKLHTRLEHWVFAEQVHGATVRFVDPVDRGKGAEQYDTSLEKCDGIYTNKTNLFLSMMYADCVPIFFFHPTEKYIGILHAGWKGTVKNIVRSLMTEWKKLAMDPSDILVTIGPSICKQCYVVDDKVINEVRKLPLENLSDYYYEIATNQYQLDLKKLNKSLLIALGVPEANIQVTNFCTSCDQPYFYSHRRDHGKTGRMAGFIGLREES